MGFVSGGQFIFQCALICLKTFFNISAAGVYIKEDKNEKFCLAKFEMRVRPGEVLKNWIIKAKEAKEKPMHA